MNVLVFGCNGQLGKCLQDLSLEFKSKHGFAFTFLDSKTGDISNENNVATLIGSNAIDLVINAAAYTAVDKAETDIDNAFAVNAQGPEYIAKACTNNNIPFIHVSTDYVFDGNATQPFTETSATNPNSVYGQSKLTGEQAVIKYLDKHVIIRTSWVFSEYGNNFVKTMLRLASERDELGIVADQKGCPTYAGDLALAILNIAVSIRQGGSNWGAFHYCGEGQTTWYGFANKIFELGLKSGLLKKLPKVNAIATIDFPTPAKRPLYSVMDTSKISQQWPVNACNWQHSLVNVITKLSAQNN